MVHLAEQLPHLVSALDSNDAYELRRQARTLGHIFGRAGAAAEATRAHYTAAARGIDHALASLESHWDRLAAPVRDAMEAELTLRKGAFQRLPFNGLHNGTVFVAAGYPPLGQFDLPLGGCPPG
jgi:predicted RNA-binding protein YlqC (UPF0109 family)